MYDDIAEGYNELHGAEQRRKLQRLLHHVDLDKIVTVADIGCGTAHLAVYFKEHDYVGIDPSRGLLEQAPEDTQIMLASGEDIPLPDSSQDLVLSLTTLHNYDDWERGIDELLRVARGIVLVGVLKRHPKAGAIVDALKQGFRVIAEEPDQHDFLLALHKP